MTCDCANIMRIYPKINIGLKVLRKRPDGYHDIETLFVPCKAFSDSLYIEKAERFSIEIDRCAWNPEEDLTAKAYRLLRDEFDLPPVKISLHKGIPVGAGLGGGSSDGAAALKMLNGMFGLGLSEKELADRASRLGSDCPFFIYDRPMFGEGRGEIFTPCEIDLSGYEIRVEMPEGVSVSTREAYAGVKPCGESNLKVALMQPVEKWKETVTNDFEPGIFAAHPEVAATKERLYENGAVYAAMSGSGSAVFGLFIR